MTWTALSACQIQQHSPIKGRSPQRLYFATSIQSPFSTFRTHQGLKTSTGFILRIGRHIMTHVHALPFCCTRLFVTGDAQSAFQIFPHRPVRLFSGRFGPLCDLLQSIPPEMYGRSLSCIQCRRNGKIKHSDRSRTFQGSWQHCSRNLLPLLHYKEFWTAQQDTSEYILYSFGSFNIYVLPVGSLVGQLQCRRKITQQCGDNHY